MGLRCHPEEAAAAPNLSPASGAAPAIGASKQGPEGEQPGPPGFLPSGCFFSPRSRPQPPAAKPSIIYVAATTEEEPAGKEPPESSHRMTPPCPT